MKKRKLVISLVCVMTLMASLFTGCGKKTEAPKENTNQTDNKEGTQTDNKAGTQTDNKGTTEAGLKIAIVTSPSGVDDGSFNQDNYNGILNFIKSNPNATVEAVKEPTGDPAAAVQAVADIVANYDVIVTPGFQFAGISTIAGDNPTKKFILIDSNPQEIDGVTEFDNIYAMTFAEEESGFFGGMAAALETKTNSSC